MNAIKGVFGNHSKSQRRQHNDFEFLSRRIELSTEKKSAKTNCTDISERATGCELHNNLSNGDYTQSDICDEINSNVSESDSNAKSDSNADYINKKMNRSKIKQTNNRGFNKKIKSNFRLSDDSDKLWIAKNTLYPKKSRLIKFIAACISNWNLQLPANIFGNLFYLT